MAPASLPLRGRIGESLLIKRPKCAWQENEVSSGPNPDDDIIPAPNTYIPTCPDLAFGGSGSTSSYQIVDGWKVETADWLAKSIGRKMRLLVEAVCQTGTAARQRPALGTKKGRG